MTSSVASKPTRTDASRISQVLYNLLTNAIKYSYDSSRIVVDGDGTSEVEAVINVTNRGMTIPPSEAARVFLAGYRGRGAAQASMSGTGMGLYVSRKIVESQGGELHLVRSDHGLTQFQFRLPVGGRTAKEFDRHTYA